MSNNKQMQNTEHTNEWVNLIEEAVDKDHLNYYEYRQFTNIQEIGSGGKLRCSISLHLFILIFEFIQRKVDFHDNVISCHGILTKLESENQISNNFMMILVYQKENWRLGASSNFQFKLFGVDPKSFSRRRNNNNLMYTLNEKSDVYSVGHRETVVPDTPGEYEKLYTKCWDENPQLLNEQELNEVPLINEQEKLPIEKGFNRIVDETNDLVLNY
ncbi:hypothetical protein C1646_764118 [Rhizophagus diaphanus]|nr:hypothetical protein C1646_764118 [Rhizophagus diaphanus] [Rhizophagus sp. MUCL 43196]